MQYINYLLIFVAIVLLTIGTIGFLRKTWGMHIFSYVFVIPSMAIFSFGIVPLVFPGSSIERQIFTVLVPTIGSIVMFYFLLRMIEKRKK